MKQIVFFFFCLKSFAICKCECGFSFQFFKRKYRGIPSPWVNTDVLRKSVRTEIRHDLRKKCLHYTSCCFLLHMCIPLPPCPYSPSFLWPLANQMLLITETIPICQNKLELYLTLPLRYERFLRLSFGGRCTVVWTSCLFSRTPWKFLKIKRQMRLFPVVDCGEWVVYEMLMWETWPLLPAEPQTSWVTLNFHLSFLQFRHLFKKKKNTTKKTPEIMIHSPFCTDTWGISKTAAVWQATVWMQPRWCWPPVWKW